MPDQEIINKGRAAAELLNSDCFKQVMASLRVDAFKNWAGSQPTDKEGREQMYMLQLALSHLENRLGAAVDNGRIEESRKDSPQATA